MSFNWRMVRVIVFNTTFNNISAMSWLSGFVLIVEEIGVSLENNQSFPSHWQPLSHNDVSISHHNTVLTVNLKISGFCYDMNFQSLEYCFLLKKYVRFFVLVYWNNSWKS